MKRLLDGNKYSVKNKPKLRGEKVPGGGVAISL